MVNEEQQEYRATGTEFKHEDTTQVMRIRFIAGNRFPIYPTKDHKFVAKIGKAYGSYIGDYPVSVSGNSFEVKSSDLKGLDNGDYRLEIWESYIDSEGNTQTSIFPSPRAFVSFTINQNIEDTAWNLVKDISFQDIVNTAVVAAGQNIVVAGTNTLPAGSQASVVQKYEDGKNEFTFNIPQGIQGPAGLAAKIHIYDTVADMREADLEKGQTARTLGDYALNDGGGATYKITDSPSSYNVDLNNGLKAEKINADGSNYYDEIKQTTKRINDTDVYFVDIPKLDKNGQPITPYIAQNGADRYFDAATKEGGYHDSPTGRNETPTEYARSEHTTLTVNGSASVMVADNTYVNGNIIGNGKILNTWLNQPDTVHVPANFVYVGIMKDRSLREFPFGTSAQQMLDAGVQNSWLSYWRLIRDGSIVDNSMSKSNEGHTRVKDLNPHLGLGIKEDGTLVIAACDGRTDTNLGLTSDDFAEAMKDYGCVNAWHMDGGGSTSVTLRGSKINRNIDGDGTRDRAIPYTFNVKKPGAGGGTANAYSQTGEVQQRVLRQVMPDIHHLNTHTIKWFGQFSFKSDDELESWLNNGLPQLINWIDYPEGAAISGIIATQYNNSAPGLQIGTTNNVNWYFKYEATGSHRYGQLIMQPIGYPGQTVIRNYWVTNWTKWYGLGVSHSSSPVIVAQGVDKCYLNQAGAVVSVDVKLTTTAAMAWDVIARGFPKPAPADIQPIQVLGQNHNTSGQIMVDHGGQLIMKGAPDLYQTHFVYLTNGVD